MSDWIEGVRHPVSRLQHDGETERWKSVHLLYPCLTWSPSTHYLWVILFLPSLSAAHSADKVLEKKKTITLNQHCRINAILTYGDFKAKLDLNSLTAASSWCCCEHLCSKAEGRSMARQAGGLLRAWPLALVSLIIDMQFHHHSSETDWGDLIPTESNIYLSALFSLTWFHLNP